jgi:hypothetical protein
MNGILKLTDRECEILAGLITLTGTYKPEPDHNYNLLDYTNKQKLLSDLDVSAQHFNRYINTFKEKGILIAGPADDELRVNPALVPIVIGDRVQITIILKINEKKNKN